MPVSPLAARIISGARGRCRTSDRGCVSGGGGDRRRHRFDDRAPETALALVCDGVLPRCDGALRLEEGDAHTAVGLRLEEGALVGLAIAYLHRAAQRCARRRGEPMPGTGDECEAREPRVVVPLHHDQGIAYRILGRDIPGLLRAARNAAEVQTLALTERVEGEPA